MNNPVTTINCQQ